VHVKKGELLMCHVRAVQCFIQVNQNMHVVSNKKCDFWERLSKMGYYSC